MIRVLSFLASENTHSMFAHPIDGVVAHVDLTNRRVAHLIDTGYNHVPMESGDYLDPQVTGPMRASMKPLHITHEFRHQEPRTQLGKVGNPRGL